MDFRELEREKKVFSIKSIQRIYILSCSYLEYISVLITLYLKKTTNLDNALYLVLPWAEDSLRPHALHFGLLHGLHMKICSTCCLQAAERQPALPWSSGMLYALCFLPSFCTDPGGLQSCFSHIFLSSLSEIFSFFNLLSVKHTQSHSWFSIKSLLGHLELAVFLHGTVLDSAHTLCYQNLVT